VNTRRVMTWLIFWSSVALALAALAWVTVEVIALEKREASAQINASRQESIRRALWRMDSQMAPILAIEASRPFSDYKSLEGARTQWLRNAGADQGLVVPSNRSNYSYANSYFEYSQDVATDDQGFSKQLSTILNLSDTDSSAAKEHYGELVTRSFKDESASPGVSNDQSAQRQKLDVDFEARKRVAEIASQSVQTEMNKPDDERSDADSEREDMAFGFGSSPFSGGADIVVDSIDDAVATDLLAKKQAADQTIGTLRPQWIADDTGSMQLVLVRSAMADDLPVVQGVWLNWDALREDLLDAVTDVMPNSSLKPVTGPRSSMIGGYQLATIPVEFIPPTNAAIISWRWSPATVGLLVTWIAIISTIVAVGIVLRAAIVLSDRRGRFVSAVTHELRTPLTTFRLYSQMLADGMVSDEDVRKEYLQILKRESERLTGIVENVLEYARLTRQRSTNGKAAGVQILSPGALVARFRPALARRAGQSNLDLVVSLDLESDQDRTITVDPHAVERIMMNLIENACKYAAPSEDDDIAIEDADTRIHFDVSIKNDTLELLVADHGPGIPQSEAARIFGEFQRGWRGLSNARSGLGLGLALSRGLAREMEGDLTLIKRRNHGAEFLLIIPLDDQPDGAT